MLADTELQRIARLTPLADVLASFDMGILPVPARQESLNAALGLTLASDIVVTEGTPQAALALRDGYALRADATVDAGSYAPAPLTPAPPRIATGEAMPIGADAVAALDAVHVQGNRAEALAPVAPGEGVLAANADIAPRTKLLLAGAKLRRIDVAILSTLGIDSVAVRQPRVRVVQASHGAVIDGAALLIARAIDAESGAALTGASTLEAALQDEGTDAVVAIGGTGSGPDDQSVRTLARHGEVAFHGIAIAPGETTAFGYAQGRPVLLLPGRMDSALAGWLTVGRRMLARLAFRLIEDQPFAAELARKIASPLGLAEVVPVRRRLGRVEPVAAGYLSLQALARAEGWVLVPADSEGHAEGSRVVVRPWP